MKLSSIFLGYRDIQTTRAHSDGTHIGVLFLMEKFAGKLIFRWTTLPMVIALTVFFRKFRTLFGLARGWMKTIRDTGTEDSLFSSDFLFPK